jgi:flagellar biogenesis protein FliO
MRAPHKSSFRVCCALFCWLLVSGGIGSGGIGSGGIRSAHAAPPAPAPPTASTPIPDYGARDSAPLTSGEAAPDPAAQAGRAIGALVIVLAFVFGAVYALKRFGWVTPGPDGKGRIKLTGLGRPSLAPGASVTVTSSQTLPGGAMLHVVTVPGRTLLLAATPHTISAVAEWPTEEEALVDTPSSAEAAAFEDYLARADASESGIAAANARLRSLLNRPPPPKDTL